MIDLTVEQANEIVKMSVGRDQFDSMPNMTKSQAVMGCILVVQAMQLLGWRVSAPLKEE